MEGSAEQSSAPMEENVDEESWVPKLEMVFDNEEKAYQFYCLYAKEMGFGVRKLLVKRRVSGQVYSRVFSCYKEGFCRTTKEGAKPRPDARTGCQAHMTVRIMDDNRFFVSKFEPNHNHELAPKSAPAVIESNDDLGGIAKRSSQKNARGRSVCRPVPKSYGSSKFASVTKLGGIGAAMRCTAVNASLQPGEGCSITDNWMPKIDIEFADDDEAYQFYVNYATRIGFTVRKHLVKRRVSGVIYSRIYVCHREGRYRGNDQQQTKDPKPNGRTGCLASMTIKITKNGRYRVSEFQQKHNHPLVFPTKAHSLKWQLRKGLIRTCDDMVDRSNDHGMALDSSKDKVDGQAERFSQSTSPSLACESYTSSKHNFVMKVGDVGAILQYVQEKQAEDPSFYYALQLDEGDQLTNFFWTDAKSVADFNYFGDVICFDSTYKTSDYGRPFTQFIGVNHHKQAVVFGAALIYNETEKSFKWLFETFKTSMHGKPPKVILTDRSVTMSNAIAAVWPGTTHRLCVWHMFNNATKHLNVVFEGSVTFAKDFRRCIYDLEEEEEFVAGWETLLEKYDLNSNEWLAELYREREKWGLAYGRQTFSADMKNTLIKERMHDVIKEYLYPELNLLDFFKHYERIVQERRQAELQLDFHARQSILKMPTSRMLRQAVNAYTPAAFKMFQREFELSLDCLVYTSGRAETTIDYKVRVDENPKEYGVRFDSANGTISCSCKKFEFVGIQCRHVLKTLDIVNVKELPPLYMLKRWTKNAKGQSPRGNCDLVIDGETKSSRAKRNSYLCCIFNKIAARAAETLESHMFVESLSDQLMDQVFQILQTRPPEKSEVT